MREFVVVGVLSNNQQKTIAVALPMIYAIEFRWLQEKTPAATEFIISGCPL
jgi:hypothetical protein